VKLLILLLCACGAHSIPLFQPFQDPRNYVTLCPSFTPVHMADKWNVESKDSARSSSARGSPICIKHHLMGWNETCGHPWQRDSAAADVILEGNLDVETVATRMDHSAEIHLGVIFASLEYTTLKFPPARCISHTLKEYAGYHTLIANLVCGILYHTSFHSNSSECVWDSRNSSVWDNRLIRHRLR